MGEGFGDYFAASFFEDRKPARYRTSVAAWDCVTDTDARPALPAARRRAGDVRELRPPTGDEHDNGPIWSATLWDLREEVGRDVADRVVVESHFQLDGFTTFARGARAILDADRNLNGGRHVAALRRVFRRRGIGPVE